MPAVLITGANRGIGFELARQYVEDDWRVVASCRQPVDAIDLNALAKKHPARLEVVQCDVNSDASVRMLSDELLGRPIDLLINNAGIVDREGYGTGAYEGTDDPDLRNYDFDQWLEVLRTNLLSPARVTATFVDHLEGGTNPIVVMMGSTLASIELTKDPGRYSYRTSKAGLNALMRSMGAWLATRGITTVTISPGWTRTDMGGPNALNSIEQSVAGVRQVIDGITPDDVGRFFNFDGTELPW
jgi:NAD(P)-dependent dehydrogenase (short-subunit alcohol dehydrogenase family)